VSLPSLALLVGAALVFSVGGYFMKLSQGLTVWGPGAAVFVCFALGAALQAIAMRGAPMSSTYIIVLGLEAVTAYALGVLALGEPQSWLKLAGALVVVLGVLLLRLADG
jgi:multidrug transporter EmrE-like cation transporter